MKKIIEDKKVTYKAILTFADGAKQMCEITLPVKEVRFFAEAEKNLVNKFNKEMPNIPNKITKVHLMRN